MSTAAVTAVVLDLAVGRTGTTAIIVLIGKGAKGSEEEVVQLDCCWTLNEGTLSAFKNSRRLGVMKDGLGGEYVWFASVAASRCTISMSKGSAPN